MLSTHLFDLFTWEVRICAPQRTANTKKLQTSMQVMICRQFCTFFHMNVQRWPEQVRWKLAEINEWLLTQRIFAPGVLMHTSVLEECVHGAHLVVSSWLHRSRHLHNDVYDIRGHYGKALLRACLCRPCTESAASATKRHYLQLKRKEYVLRHHFS